MVQVVWFKRDLRIEDHAPLCEAARRGPVLALYIAEPAYWALPDTSARQWGYIAESLEGLSSDLSRIGLPLVVRSGDAVEVLDEIHRELGIDALWSHEETGNFWTFQRDRAVHRFCRNHGIAWREFRQFGVFRGAVNRDRWSDRWEAMMAERTLAPPAATTPSPPTRTEPIPSARDLGLAEDPCPGRQSGNRQRALADLRSFLDGRGADYVAGMSSPLTAFDACSRLSAALAAGTVSMREVVRIARQARTDYATVPPSLRPIPLKAIDALVSRLHWHCHFIQKLETEPEIEFRSQHPFFEVARHPTSDHDPILLAWIEGRTGWPFLDACMRALRRTGWINFRMRAMLIAVASHHLALDWAATGRRLAALFTDYEPGIHWAQTQMQAGQTGINTPRLYNPVKQGHDQDPDGRFIRRFVPELAALPTAMLHEPWRFSGADLARHGLRLDRDYPAPITDHEAAVRAARARLAQVRAQSGFREAAHSVYQRHGSRRRSFDDDNPSRSKAIAEQRARRAGRQLSLDL